MLGFKFLLKESGKVVVTVLSDNVKAERQKLRKMVKKALRGELTKEKVDGCYESWKAHARYGDSYNLLNRMDEFYRNLWRNGYDNQEDSGFTPAERV